MYFGYLIVAYNLITFLINLLRIANLYLSVRDDVILNEKDENP